MHWFLITLVSLKMCLTLADTDFCGDSHEFLLPKGRIETNDDTGLSNCTWTITTTSKSVLYFTVEYLQLGKYDDNEENCFNITSLNKDTTYLSQCSDTNYPNTFSVPSNEVLISLVITSESFVAMKYTSYLVNCTQDQMLCRIGSRIIPMKITENVCQEGMIVCDRSCRADATVCGDFCYDVYDQRCNGIIDCSNAEDEIGCAPQVCPNKIQCSNQSQCVEARQICDGTINCVNGFDESRCPKSICDENEESCYIQNSLVKEDDEDEALYTVIIILGILAALFLTLICRCIASRDSVRNVFDNPLDIPLPPFSGPTDGPSSIEDHPFSDEDFCPGGEIYESFAKNVEKIKSKRKTLLEIEPKDDITFVKPPPGQSVLDKYFNGVKPALSEELAALATIKISRDMCYGLRKAKSEERPMTKLLFLDNKDEEMSSDDSETEKHPTTTNLRRNSFRTKSDTDYIRRKNLEIAIV